MRATTAIAREQFKWRNHATEFERAGPLPTTADLAAFNDATPSTEGVVASMPTIEESWAASYPQPIKKTEIPTVTVFEPLQEWEGYVLEVADDEFRARLQDKTHGAPMETDEVVFSWDDVSEGDRELVRKGAVFRWSLGYEKSRAGVRRKVSSLVFRRLPIWTKRDLVRSRERARKLIESIKWID